LVVPVVSKAFSFVDPFVSNVLSFIILIVDSTFSFATLVVSKGFCFVSFTIEPTFFFVSPTFFWAFSTISLVFYYTVPMNWISFCFSCSKIKLTSESYSSLATSYWTSSFQFNHPCVACHLMLPRLKHHDPWFD
jgi:hypothetical protein